MLVPRVERRHVVGLAARDRPEQSADPVGRDAAQVAVDDRRGGDAQRPGRLEDGTERRAFSGPALVAAGDRRDAVRRLADTVARPVVGAAVGVHNDRPSVREMATQSLGRRPRDVADGRGILVARDPDEELGASGLS